MYRDRHSKNEFDWRLYPEAENFLSEKVKQFNNGNKISLQVAKRIESETSTRFMDWVDHIKLPVGAVSHEKLIQMGFRSHKDAQTDSLVFSNPEAVFFPILIGGPNFELAIKTDDLDLFRRVFSSAQKIDGERGSPLRELVIKDNDGYNFKAVERRGYGGYSIDQNADTDAYFSALELFMHRKRNVIDSIAGIEELVEQVDSIHKYLEKTRLLDAFFRAERQYWLSRNDTAQAQKKRQDSVGLGWANHDHHTFRSSRICFRILIKLFEGLGLELREAFHAGAQAGWGAQILENSETGIVVFADLDIPYDEKSLDFSHEYLEETSELGTVGTWVGLQGESIMEAGMHHMAVRLSFKKVETDLKELGISFMKPFSNFDFLKQEFSVGEKWGPIKHKIDELHDKGYINRSEYRDFIENGAIGSHLENIERGKGFKGFNQDSVSVIIKETDPRKQKRRGA
jgi:hypothetical protein